MPGLYEYHRKFTASILPILIGAGCVSAAAGEVDFGRDIRPILSAKCFSCHGPDSHKRDADYRLDTKEGAFADLGGYYGIVPGKPEKSEVIFRITEDDPDEIMPPPEHKNPLTPAEIELITKWIDEGAHYTGHWAYEPITKHAPPEVESETVNPIDHFLAAKLEEEGLSFSEEAPPETQVRRIYLDLTGLPPTPEQVQEFLAASDGGYEQIIDEIMESPAFAERLALEWLDVARFADTNGYSIDDHRDMWIWRDWVIDAFSRNMPYDQFIVEQLAGDLIPGATDKQKIATGFLRNSMNTHEGGTIAEEYRVAYTADKVDTVTTAFLGLTVKCAQCHDHKYDPISMKDYYRFFAFFNKTSEPGKGATNANTKPFIQVEPILQNDDEFKSALNERIEALEYIKANPTKVLSESENNKNEIDKVTKSIDTEIKILRKSLKSGKTSAMVMDSGAKDRDTFILERGSYDSPGEKVTAGIPEMFGKLPKDAEADRLALAKWLTDPEHPLTARVTVNRYWQMIFGTGIVKTAEDFGSQGEWPSHPELLDWLAADFIESGWDVKSLIKNMLMSRAYRQSSVVNDDLLKKDPYNRLMARAPRYRLPAEMVRDNALAVAGLLNNQIGGPSVYPPQPKGLWKEVSHFGHPTVFTAQHYYPDQGEQSVRRSMYTFWKRTSPPPIMTTFDAPNRETCMTRRSLTNTPLQALVLMNAPQFVEASGGLAKRMEKAGSQLSQQIEAGFRLATSRSPEPAEIKVLENAMQRQTAYFNEDPQRADDYLKAAGVESDEPVRFAALMSVASLILNLDETITRE